MKEPIQDSRSGSATAVVDTEVEAKPKRRTFTAEYKLRILGESDAASPGERGMILRREGLYSSHLSEWRAARRRGAIGSLGRKRGRKANPNRDAERKIVRLERELTHTKEELRRAHLILDVQGKVAGLLGLNFDHEKNS